MEEIRQLLGREQMAATVVLDQLDDVCVVGNTSKHYNFLEVETG
jgi:hypothetical protein